jgi:hypothetical protein
VPTGEGVDMIANQRRESPRKNALRDSLGSTQQLIFWSHRLGGLGHRLVKPATWVRIPLGYISIHILIKTCNSLAPQIKNPT